VNARDLGDGWFAIGLEAFPFPLVAKTTALEPNQLVHWVFSGFWRGEGEVRLTSSGGTTQVEGYEEISVRWLFQLSPLLERLFLESRFRSIWQLGWKRLRKRERPAHLGATPSADEASPPDPSLQRTTPGQSAGRAR
jgi:hypothetical protein